MGKDQTLPIMFGLGTTILKVVNSSDYDTSVMRSNTTFILTVYFIYLTCREDIQSFSNTR